MGRKIVYTHKTRSDFWDGAMLYVVGKLIVPEGTIVAIIDGGNYHRQSYLVGEDSVCHQVCGKNTEPNETSVSVWDAFKLRGEYVTEKA